jgi:hypothetical protein
VLSIVASLRARGIPTFMGGDLNSTPESATQDTVRGAGLRDVWTMCGQDVDNLRRWMRKQGGFKEHRYD